MSSLRRSGRSHRQLGLFLSFSTFHASYAQTPAAAPAEQAAAAPPAHPACSADPKILKNCTTPRGC